jgi:hypothetical protein
MRAPARLIASSTRFIAPGCQVIAMSTSAKQPARTMKVLAAPPSSAGQP